MSGAPFDLAQVRLDNALALFDEFVRATARQADPATLRGLERRFAEKVQIQPSYWSQIKSRSRQIGERLARQFEHLCHKPRGWMDQAHPGLSGPGVVQASGEPGDAGLPRDDDERFVVGLVLTYYRRHPQRARARLLDLLGEVLIPSASSGASSPGVAGSAAVQNSSPLRGLAPGDTAETDLLERSRTGVSPLKQRR